MSRTKTLVFLVIGQAVYALFLVVWLFVLGMSVMLFDSPGSETSALPWAVVGVILAYPAGLLLAVIMGWISFARKKYRPAAIWNCLPLLWLLPIAGFLLYANLS